MIQHFLFTFTVYFSVSVVKQFHGYNKWYKIVLETGNPADPAKSKYKLILKGTCCRLTCIKCTCLFYMRGKITQRLVIAYICTGSKTHLAGSMSLAELVVTISHRRHTHVFS